MRRMIDRVYVVRRWLLKVLRIETRGVKVLVHDPDRGVLLIRNRYGGDAWLLPGGGIACGKPPADAARRELYEETGLTVENLRFFARYRSDAEGRGDTIDLFIGTATDTPAADLVEVAAVRFFALASLPDTTSPATQRRIAEWQGSGVVDGRW